MRLFLFILLLFPSILFAQESNVYQEVLDNGLTVVIQPLSVSNSVSFNLFVKAGSVNETGCLGCGMSHFIEHMLFKGTKKRGVGVIPQEVKQLGGIINAHTSLEETVYKLDLPKDKYKEGLDILSDMLFNPLFDENELEKEREVIRGEMRLYRDKPIRQLSELVFDSVYIYHPYQYPIIGYQDLFDKVTREQLVNYYKQHYVPNNMILSISGDVDVNQLMPEIKRLFAHYNKAPLPQRIVMPEPDIITPRVVRKNYAGEIYYASYSFLTIGMLDRDLYALDLLSMILSSGYDAPLTDILYKKEKLVNSISASSFTPIDKGVFEFEMVMDKDNTHEVVKVIHDLLDDIHHKGVNAKFFNKVKKEAVAQFRQSSQRASQFSARNAQDLAYTATVDFSKKYVDGLNAVTQADIKRVIKKYLNPLSSVLVVLQPEKIESKNELTQDVSLRLNEKKPIIHTLSNGIKVAIIKTPEIKLFHATAIFRGGLREETSKNNGISHLFSRIWTFSSKKWPNDKLSVYLDENTLKLGSFYHTNGLGLNISGLSEDMTKGIDVLADVILNPVFDQQELSRKKEDILISHKARQDDITSLTYRRIFERFYENHPYGLDEMGDPEVIKNISINHLKEYHQRFINPQNLLITIGGDVDEKNVIKLLEDKFGQWLGGNPLALYEGEFSGFNKKLEEELIVPKEQAIVSFAFNAPSIYSKDRWVMEIIDNLLGSGLGGRLYTKIREQFGGAYTMGVNYIPGIKEGIFVIHVQTSMADTQRVREVVINEIQQLQKVLVGVDELTSIKNSFIGRQDIGLDTPASIAWQMANDAVYGFDFDEYLKLKQNIEHISSDDIKRVAQKYLIFDHSLNVMTKPKN